MIISVQKILLTIVSFAALSAAFMTNSLAQDTTAVPRNPEAIADSTLFVDKILISGNGLTKDFVILREMTLKPGSVITRTALDYDRDRIYSLGLFTQVEMHIIPTQAPKASVLVIVSERWYIYPYPILGIKDRDWGKLYYGAGITHLNFRGRNEKLTASFVFGYDPGFFVSYRNPFLSQEGRTFLEGRIGSNKVRNKSLLVLPSPDVDFDERHITASLTIGQRYGIAHTAWFTLGYEYVGITNYFPGSTISPSGEDMFPVIGAGYTYDTRDLQEYPSYGSYLRVTVTKSGITADAGHVNTIHYTADGRRFVPLLPATTLGVRAFTDLMAAGPVPSYQRVFFGYNERIRGHFREVIEGESILGASAELHYMIVPTRYFSVEPLPREFGVWKFGVAAAVFADVGTIRFRGTPLALNDVLKGYGAGLHFLLPYSFVLRAEYALNEVRDGEFILDLGSWF